MKHGAENARNRIIIHTWSKYVSDIRTYKEFLITLILYCGGFGVRSFIAHKKSLKQVYSWIFSLTKAALRHPLNSCHFVNFGIVHPRFQNYMTIHE